MVEIANTSDTDTPIKRFSQTETSVLAEKTITQYSFGSKKTLILYTNCQRLRFFLMVGWKPQANRTQH